MTAVRRAVARSLLLCLLVPAVPLEARGAPAGTVGIVVYGGNDSAQARSTAADVARWRLGDPPSTPWQPIPLDESPEWSPGRPWVTGAGAPQRCEGTPVEVAALRTSLKAIRQEIDGLLLVAARRDLDLVEAALACLSEVPTTRDLIEVPFLRGVLEYYDGRIDAAADAFRAALALDPILEWDDGYGPDVRRVFEQARSGLAVAALSPAKVRVTLARGGQAHIDGRTLPNGEHHIAAGTHIFQVKKGNRVATVKFQAAAGREVRLYDGEAVWAAVTSANPSSEAANLLASLAQAYGRTRACAWAGSPQSTVTCWDERQTGALTGTSPVKPSAAVAAQSRDGRAGGGEARPSGDSGAAPPSGSSRAPHPATVVSATVMIGGLVTAGVGAVLFGSGYSTANPIATQHPECINGDSSDDSEDCEDLYQEYYPAYYDLYVPGRATLAVGGGIAVAGIVGLAISSTVGRDASVRVSPRLGPGEMGLGISGRW